MGKPRRAVVLVHGQGEQRPMEMGPQFVEHVFMADFDPATASSGSAPQVRWVAENQSGIDELRRIEVRYADDRPDFDIFELYWAPLMGDSRSSHFLMWFFGLLRRSRKDIPKRVRYVHTLSIALVWMIFLLAGFYLYATFSSMMPIQFVQIADHGLSDIFQFSFDWRLAAVLSASMLFAAAAFSIALRNYGWCLSFLVSSMAICLTAPLVVGSPERIMADLEWVRNNSLDPPQFTIWGLDLHKGRVADAGPIASAAARLSRYLCTLGEVDTSEQEIDEEADTRPTARELADGTIVPVESGPEVDPGASKADAEIVEDSGSYAADALGLPDAVDLAANAAADAAAAATDAAKAIDDAAPSSEQAEPSDLVEPEPIAEDDIDQARDRIVNLATNRGLSWDDMEPNRGAQIKDLCLAPVALTNPVMFARVADSAHIFLSTLIIAFAVLFYCIWRAFLKEFIVDIMGDSARYLNSHPKNNIARHNIRQSGLTLLGALHHSGRYDKIILCAHSLGSIVAYDALRQYWGHSAAAGIIADTGALERSRVAAAALGDDADGSDAIGEWQDAQHDVFSSLDKNWLISDFVTMGSPLSHGRLLLENSSDTVHASGRFASQRDVTRSILACPPVDIASSSARLTPWDMFLAVRWTNLYFDDDVVGGTVAADADGLLFGRGAKDLKYSAKQWAVPGLSHNSYWMSNLSPADSSDVPWLAALRSILGIGITKKEPLEN